MVGRPSDVFCGNWVKQADRACTSKATDSNGNRPAQEHVEIRGWIVGVDGPDTPGQHPENEYRFNVLLDHGWTPATPSGAGIFPINTPEAINATITPDNVIWFGQNDSAKRTCCFRFKRDSPLGRNTSCSASRRGQRLGAS